MSSPTLFDIASGQASLIAQLGEGSVFGAVAERVAAHVTRSVRITGTGRDLRCPADVLPDRTSYDGLSAPGPVRVPYAKAAGAWDLRTQRRYEKWLAEPDLLGEVKVRMQDKRWAQDTQLLDTRGGGPATPFFPFVDFYVVMMLDLAGDITMARYLTLPEMIDYVASDIGRGGAWNYKVSIGMSAMEGIGTDLTESARAALRTLRVHA